MGKDLKNHYALILIKLEAREGVINSNSTVKKYEAGVQK
jgi:hypothetical protein